MHSWQPVFILILKMSCLSVQLVSYEKFSKNWFFLQLNMSCDYVSSRISIKKILGKLLIVDCVYTIIRAKVHTLLAEAVMPQLVFLHSTIKKGDNVIIKWTPCGFVLSKIEAWSLKLFGILTRSGFRQVLLLECLRVFLNLSPFRSHTIAVQFTLLYLEICKKKRPSVDQRSEND